MCFWTPYVLNQDWNIGSHSEGVWSEADGTKNSRAHFSSETEAKQDLDLSSKGRTELVRRWEGCMHDYFLSALDLHRNEILSTEQHA